jgi:hypothetical protein
MVSLPAIIAYTGFPLRICSDGKRVVFVVVPHGEERRCRYIEEDEGRGEEMDTR